MSAFSRGSISEGVVVSVSSTGEYDVEMPARVRMVSKRRRHSSAEVAFDISFRKSNARDSDNDGVGVAGDWGGRPESRRAGLAFSSFTFIERRFGRDDLERGGSGNGCSFSFSRGAGECEGVSSTEVGVGISTGESLPGNLWLSRVWPLAFLASGAGVGGSRD